MQIKLNVNGFDVSRWCQEEGITLYDIPRQSRSIVTRDGVEHRKQILKRGISVSIVEMRDVTLAKLEAALKDLSTVAFTDRNGMERAGVLMYVSAVTATAKTVRGGITYFNGISFTLEER